MQKTYYHYVNNELLSAIHKNDIPAIDALLAKNVQGKPLFDINAPRDTPLSYAVRFAEPATIAHLLKHGANVDLCPEHGELPLTLALMGYRPDVTKLLLEHGASPYPFKETPYSRSVPLVAAILSEQYEWAEELLNREADVNAPTKCRYGKANLFTPLAGIMGDSDIEFDTEEKYRKAVFFLVDRGGLPPHGLKKSTAEE